MSQVGKNVTGGGVSFATSAGQQPEVANANANAATATPADSVSRRFAHASGASAQRYVVTSQGTFHLTPTELALVRILEELDGKAISRAELAHRLRRNTKVISRLITNLRREGVIQSEPVFGENGAQLANRYRIAPDAVPLD